MGSSKEKQSSSTTINQSTAPTPTAEQTKLNQLDLQLREQNQGALGQMQASGLNLGNLLLQGMQLPGYLKGLPGGIDEQTTQGLVDSSLRDIQPMFAQSGLIDSGVRASISARTANDTRLNSAQFNIQNLSQLLNLALGGQAQVQQPQISQAGMLGQRLAGLSSVNTTGTSSGTTTSSSNPFMRSFGSSLGNSLGGGAFGAMKFGA